ncbi:hypothetical protein TDIS_1735 [Thermosulfurimonas dismutans]|uniref:Uncharacterized protein n=1 Tax=Thermosulfurimonas dismutans TaxID=999894 RepID=A0A179D2M8_9BACT|nr:hypothetical protein TDIS_1735 [Thermosulfurimonas dismutans]
MVPGAGLEPSRRVTPEDDLSFTVQNLKPKNIDLLGVV